MDGKYSLLGVILKGDNSAKDDGRCLGAIKLFNSQIREFTLEKFRDVMKKQLICFVENLQFCTKEGWGIRSGLENILKVGDILSEEKTIHVQWNQ